MVDGTELTPLPADRAVALRQTARDVVRGWLALADPNRIGDKVGSIGAQAIAAGADSSRRLLASLPPQADAGTVLDALRRLAEGAVPQPPARGWRMFQRPAPPVDIEAELGVIVAQLEEQRDRLMLAAVRIASERERVAEADRRLEEAAHLIRTLIAGADAAAREIGSSDPTRAAVLRGAAAEKLHERLGDVLTQLAVTRQGRLSLEIIRDGYETLAGAIDRARSTMVAALRTAALAGRAVAEGQRLGEQAAALDRTASAAGAASPERAVAVRRALDDAIAQVSSAAEAARR